ncbi:hypothetical protein V7S43_000902 [Phytophthora oleae]|uniref:UPF3 domain-containing protein n=1 Tax=Phytophthora oleae TaxID=2107226 RepID=A0ABD3G9V6_9STRA
MSPPPRRGSGKGRGRGGRGGDRNGNVSEGSNLKPKKRERGNNSKRGGRGGGGASAAASSSVVTARPTRAVTTVLKKLVVRNVPPMASEQEARDLLQTHDVDDEFVWRFVPGHKRSNNRAPTSARLYLDMKKEPEKARKLIAVLHGQMFYADAKENADVKPLDVEFAPFQKVPREKQRKDAKVGTIDKDPDFVAFLEELAKPKDKLPSAEAVADMAEGELVEKPVAALVKYLNERKVHSRDKGKGRVGKLLDKNGRRQKGKKEGSKQKLSKEKSKSSKDRQKKTSGDVASAQEPKNRKQRGRASSKKESTKQEPAKAEPAQPGMLRIMTPKSAVAASALTPVSAAKSNGTAPSTDNPSERSSEKRGPKGGKKNGGRGRNSLKKGKDGGEGADGEGSSKPDSKQQPRRKGGNSSKKEPNKGERKKKVFAPKDATSQGTPAKS